MHQHLTHDSTRRWSGRVALLIGLAALLVTLAPTLGAQGQDPPPHWTWGDDLSSYAGAEIQALNQDGDQIGSATVASNGGWSIIIAPDDARTATLQLAAESGARATDPFDVVDAGFTRFVIADFSNAVDDSAMAEDTITVRIIARRADDGRIEFGMRDADGEDILPPARFFPEGGPGHSRWLRSTEIDFGGGFVGRIIARYVEADGRTEFGFRVEGRNDIFPRARFFPATGPDHDRWLRSSEIEINQPG